MKHSDYLKKKKNRETRKRIISVISAIIVFVTAYTMVLPAITLDVSTARQEPGFAFEQVQFKTTAAAASVTAADSTVEEVPVQTSASQEPEEEETTDTIEEEPAENSGEEASAVSDEQEEAPEKEPDQEEAPAEPDQEEAPAEPEQEEAPAEETEEVQEDKSEDSGSGTVSVPESDSSQEQAADTQKTEEDASVDQPGTDAADEAETTAEAAADFQIPQLDALDFDDILTGRTAFYYYHPESAEEAENLSSDSIDDWKKADADTVLAPEDFVRVYLSYEIPAGALNETNAAARYRLPAGLELSDKQIEAVNKYENGIAASMSGSDHDKYLGAEAIEGSRTPEEKADNEYISATVKAEKVYHDGSYAGQDLIFTFIPYTVEKNQISYDAKGEVIAKGGEVKGFFTFDLTTAQIGFEKTDLETVEREDGTKEAIQYSKADIDFAKDIDRTLTLAECVENDEAQSAADQDDAKAAEAEDKTAEDKAAEDKAAEDKTAETQASKTKLRSKAGGALKAGDGAERTVVATGSAGSTVTWTLYDDGEVVFSGSGAVQMGGEGSLTAYKDQVKKMTFEEGITAINNTAFTGYESLENITFPSTIETIGRSAFSSCNALKAVDLSNTSIKIINLSAFAKCSSLKSVDLSGCTNLGSVGDSAFYSCTSLESVKFSGCDNLKTIERSAFSKCTSLETLDLSGLPSLECLKNNAFSDCTNLRSVDLSNCASLKKIGNDSGESSIFQNCTSLEEVKVDGTPIEVIGNSAFYGCRSLKKFDFSAIKDTLKTFKWRAFSGTGLSEVNLDGCANLQTIGSQAFYDVKCETLNFNGCTSLETIDENAFSNNSLVKKLDLSNCTALKTIGTAAFSGFSALESIDLTNCSSLETVGNTAFSARNNVFSELKFDGCSSLKTIGDGAFQNLALGKNLTIDLTPLTSLETIGKSAFSGNKTVGTIVIPESVKTIGNSAFYGGAGYYAAASNIDAVDFSGANNLETIGNNAFQHTTIRTADFSGCSNLKSIGENAFDGCKQLQTVDLSKAVELESIGKEAFKDCVSTTYIAIPKSVTTIDESAFANDAAVTKLLWNAENYNKPIGSGTFNKSNGFSSGYELVIGEDVNTLPTGFFKAVSCGDVFFRPNSRIDMSADATQGAPVPISNIDGPCYVDAEGVVYEIEGEGDNQYARVAYCPPGIDQYTIPATIPFEGKDIPVKEIGNSAFVLARDLEEIKLEDASGITSVGNNAFYGIETLTKVTDNKTGNTKTTVSGAISLFTGTTAPRSAFLKTGLEDDTEQIWKDGNPVQSLYVENGDIKVKVDKPSNGNGETGYTWNETEKRYEYYTGAYLNTKVSATNTSTKPVTARIYLNYSNDSYEGLRESFTVGDTNPIAVEIKDTSDPDVKYLEFTLGQGKTVNFSLVTTYPSPESAGGDLRIWVDIPEEGSDELKPLTSQDDYMSAVWTTQRQERNVEKVSGRTGNKTYSIHGDGTGSTNFIETHLWKISLPNTGETAKNAVGKDYCESVLYKDKLVLPEGWKWSDDLLTAIADHKYGTRKSGSTIYFYIIKGDGSAADVCSIKIPNGTSRLEDLALTPVVDADNRQNIEFSWKLRAATGEYPTDILEFSIMEPFLETGDINNYPADGYVLKNNIDVLLDYAHSKDQKLDASASTKVVAGEANLKFTKSRSTGTLGDYTILMGKKHTFYLDVSNTGTRNTTELCTITDPLNEYMYIQATDMEQMFSNVYGDKLEITIEGAQLFHDPERNTAIGIDGSSVSITAANSDHAGAVGAQKTITIKKGVESGYIISVDGEEHTCTSLQKGLDSLGYVVTPSAKYGVKWTFNSPDASDTTVADRFTVFGGMAFRLPIYVTHKNTFEMLDTDWLEFYDFPNYDAEYDMNNTAVMLKADQSTLAASCPRYKLKKDVSLEKKADRNGTPLAHFSTQRFSDGDVITYHLKTVNRGASIYDLPVVDNMSGAQFMLVPVDGNHYADWGQGGTPDIYTDSSGTQYYRLDRTAEHHKVLTSAGFIADTITVEKLDDGWKTDIKWYYPELTGSFGDKRETISTISYKALVQSSNITFNLSNYVYLNDRYDDRLYTLVGGGGSSVGFNKQIVTKNPNFDGKTEGEECDPNNYSALTKDNHDTVYKLTISGEGAGNIAVTGKDFFDRLPQTFGAFEWNKDNVEITFRSSRDDLVLTEGLDAWEITQKSPYPSMWQDDVEGQYYICWPENAKIQFKGRNGDKPAELFLYVTLHFTDDWSNYCSKASGAKLTNSLYVNTFPKIVTHDVQAEGSVIMQKGVHSISHMGDTNSRVYFEKENSNVNYYIVLYNGGMTRFYLNDIVDTLPAGFGARGFNGYSSYGNLGDKNNPVTTPSKVKDSYCKEYKAGDVASITPSEKDVVYKHAKIYGVNDSANHTFTIHFVETSETERENGFVGYDPNVGKPYLDPNEAVVFKYIVNINPDVANDEVVNTNRISMDYYDPNSVGVTVNKDIDITAGNTTLDAEPNDGNCVVVNKPEGGKQLISEVSIRSGEILPGISKSVTSYEEFGLRKNIEFGQEAIVSPTANLLWEVRSYNEGTKDVNGYKIKDTMQAPYRFSGDVKYVIYDSENSTTVDAEPRDPVNNISKPLFTIIGTNEKSDGTGTISIRDLVGNEYTLELGGEPVELALPNIYLAYHGKSRDAMAPNNWGGVYYNVGKSGSVRVSFAIDKKTKEETMLLEFPENTMAIYPGCVGKLSVWTNTPGNSFINTTYVNTADLIPDEKEYESSMINHGNPAFDNEGKNDYVESYGFVTTASGYASSSRKHVTEKNDPANTAHSYEPVNYITLSEKENVFTYTLEVENINEDTTFDKITFVDNLPYIGDGYTLRNDIKRNSQYEVKFARNPNVTVSVLYPDGKESTLDSSQFTVKFSDKQVLNLERGQANDWDSDASTWGDQKASSRSVLVNITDGSRTLMTGGSKIRVSFDAVASDDAKPGMIAYNSYAYNYEVEGVPLESSPLIVGTRIRDYPYIQKVLVDKNGSSYKTDKDLTFKFLVFKGDKSLISGAGDADLQTYLAQNDIPNHVFDVKVSKDQSSSGQVRLSPTADWAWENSEKYTVVELPEVRAYNFNRWKNGGSGAYTFTYNASRTQVFTAENVNIEWDVHLLKVDAEDDETHLKGAVFARYSPNRLDAITDEACNTIKSNYGLNPVRSYEEKDSDGNVLHTWYLADAKETGRDGTIDWEDLVEDEYDLVEIKAPDGYMIEDKTYRVTRHDNVDDQGRVLITMKNQKGYELPSTGGIGRLPFMFTGLFLIMASALMYGFRMRQRERRFH